MCMCILQHAHWSQGVELTNRYRYIRVCMHIHPGEFDNSLHVQYTTIAKCELIVRIPTDWRTVVMIILGCLYAYYVHAELKQVSLNNNKLLTLPDCK